MKISLGENLISVKQFKIRLDQLTKIKYDINH